MQKLHPNEKFNVNAKQNDTHFARKVKVIDNIALRIVFIR